MARYSASIESQTSQTSGVNAGTTVNGYCGYWGASATSGYKLRRVTCGLRMTSQTSIPIQQVVVGLFRQTTAPAGTGIAAAIPGQAQEIWTPVDPTAGFFAITAGTIGTTAPVLDTNPFKRLVLNSQNSWSYDFEFLDEVIVNKGTANGIAPVILNIALPTNAVLVLDYGVEV